jgi:DNA-directed RNA polymerase subunit M/transcription elongation factor TFIIS
MVKCPQCGYEFEIEEKSEAVEEIETFEDVPEDIEQVQEHEEDTGV